MGHSFITKISLDRRGESVECLFLHSDALWIPLSRDIQVGHRYGLHENCHIGDVFKLNGKELNGRSVGKESFFLWFSIKGCYIIPRVAFILFIVSYNRFFAHSLELRSSGANSLAMVRWSSMELMLQGEDGEDLEPAKLKTVTRQEVAWINNSMSNCYFYYIFVHL